MIDLQKLSVFKLKEVVQSVSAVNQPLFVHTTY